MNPASWLVAALVVVPALGLAFLACCVMDQVAEEMDNRSGWKRVPFEDSTVSRDPSQGMT